MKIEFFKRLLDMLRKNDNVNKKNESNLTKKDEIFGEETFNLTSSGSDTMRTMPKDVPADGYVRLTGERMEVVTKEIAVNEMYDYIQRFLKENVKMIPRCNVTESEWRIFLEVAYDQFVEYNLHSGYTSLMQVSIEYIFYKQYLYSVSQVTFQDVVEQFDISILPSGVANTMIENIRKKVYLAVKGNNNIIDFEEYRRVARR